MKNGYLIKYKAEVTFFHEVSATSEEEAFKIGDSKDFNFKQKIVNHLNSDDFDVSIEDVSCVWRPVLEPDDNMDRKRDDRKIHNKEC